MSDQAEGAVTAEDLDEEQLSWVRDVIDSCNDWGTPVMERLLAAYLASTAPRAPDAGVSREEIVDLFYATAWVKNGDGSQMGGEEFADAILARLAPVRAGQDDAGERG